MYRSGDALSNLTLRGGDVGGSRIGAPVAERHFCEGVTDERTARVRLPCTASKVQCSRCGHGWRIACTAAVFVAGLLLAHASTTQQPAARSWAHRMMEHDLMVRLETEPHW
jgi:hypothetical protein